MSELSRRHVTCVRRRVIAAPDRPLPRAAEEPSEEGRRRGGLVLGASVSARPPSARRLPLRPPRPCSQRSLSIQILQNHMQFTMFKTYDKDMEFFFCSVMCRHLVPGTDLSQRMEDGNSEGRAWHRE